MREKMYKLIDKFDMFIEKVKVFMVATHMAKWVEEDFEQVEK